LKPPLARLTADHDADDDMPLFLRAAGLNLESEKKKKKSQNKPRGTSKQKTNPRTSAFI
jgi:hypothetical protein